MGSSVAEGAVFSFFFVLFCFVFHLLYLTATWFSKFVCGRWEQLPYPVMLPYSRRALQMHSSLVQRLDLEKILEVWLFVIISLALGHVEAEDFIYLVIPKYVYSWNFACKCFFFCLRAYRQDCMNEAKEFIRSGKKSLIAYPKWPFSTYIVVWCLGSLGPHWVIKVCTHLRCAHYVNCSFSRRIVCATYSLIEISERYSMYIVL